jgi:hypothetical protein
MTNKPLYQSAKIGVETDINIGGNCIVILFVDMAMVRKFEFIIYKLNIDYICS